MGLFDKDLTEKPVFTEASFIDLKKNTFLGDLLDHQGALICWTNNGKGLSALADMINMNVLEVRNSFLLPGKNVGTIGVFSPDEDALTAPPVLQNHRGRSIITLDCSGLGKDDALGFLRLLSLLQKEQRPIVVINNITSIPRAGSNIDDPLYVEDILLHSWHNDVFQLTDKDGAPFTMSTKDYTILIPVSHQEKANINMSRLRNDCYPQLQFEESKSSWMAKDFLNSFEYYVKLGRVSKEQGTAVKDYLKYNKI